MYSVAGGGSGTLMPQMKTFYQKPNAAPVSVAPYATTTLINTSGTMGGGGGSTLGKPMQSNVSIKSAFDVEMKDVIDARL